MMNFLEPVVFPIQCHTSHRADTIPTEVARTPRVSQIVSGLATFLVSYLHRAPRFLAAASIADLKTKLPGCVGAK